MIELLDFVLPSTPNANFQVSVTAQPQALMLFSNGMATTSALNGYSFQPFNDIRGFVGTDLSQFAMCNDFGFYTAQTTPHRIFDNTKCLRSRSRSNTDELSVECTALSSDSITFDCTGNLLNGQRIYGYAISGISWARALSATMASYPVTFTGAPDTPDFGIVHIQGAPISGAVNTEVLQDTICEGYMNGTQQISLSHHVRLPTNNMMYTTPDAVANFYDRVDGSAFRGKYTGTFTSDGLSVSPVTTGVVRSQYSMGAFLMAGIVSDVRLHQIPALAGSTNHSFQFDPEALMAVASTNQNLDTVENPAVAWPLHSRLMLTPGETIAWKSLVSGISDNTSFNVSHRALLNTNHLAISAGQSNTGQYRCHGAPTSFDGSAAEINWTSDGTGNPDFQRYFATVAIAASVAPPQPPGGTHHPFGRGPWS